MILNACAPGFTDRVTKRLERKPVRREPEVTKATGSQEEQSNGDERRVARDSGRRSRPRTQRTDHRKHKHWTACSFAFPVVCPLCDPLCGSVARCSLALRSCLRFFVSLCEIRFLRTLRCLIWRSPPPTSPQRSAPPRVRRGTAGIFSAHPHLAESRCRSRQRPAPDRPRR